MCLLQLLLLGFHICNSLSPVNQDAETVIYVSYKSKNADDSSECGTQEKPCRTLKLASASSLSAQATNISLFAEVHEAEKESSAFNNIMTISGSGNNPSETTLFVTKTGTRNMDALITVSGDDSELQVRTMTFKIMISGYDIPDFVLLKSSGPTSTLSITSVNFVGDDQEPTDAPSYLKFSIIDTLAGKLVLSQTKFSNLRFSNTPLLSVSTENDAFSSTDSNTFEYITRNDSRRKRSYDFTCRFY